MKPRWTEQAVRAAALGAFVAGVAAAGAARADTVPPAAVPALRAGDDDAAASAMRQAAFDAAMTDAAERQQVFADASDAVRLDGTATQGGLMFGATTPGAQVFVDGEPVDVDPEGRFLVGFGRDHAASALLVVTLPDGTTVRRSLAVSRRDFPVDRIDGVDQSKVSGFTPEQLEKIARDRELKAAARAVSQDVADWASGFSWPTVGRISGVFGSQRVLNGEPKRPHSGVDVAVPTGTPVRAPAPGIVRLAEPDMYFEGGLILLDHGQRLESAFLHLSRIDVEPGQRVEAGETIGAVGATGRATGPHLHWSMKWRGVLLDAALVAGPMPADGAATAAE